MTLVALAGCRSIADPDEQLLSDALARGGIDVEAVAWDDPHVDWDRYDATVVRSTWGYDEDLEGFLGWARRVPRLHNGAEVLEWNADKHYLDELAADGVATIPTTYARSGEAARLPDGEVVVKPTVGGGARGVARFGADQHGLARAHVDDLAGAGRVAMIQPFVAPLALHGETDVVFVDGAYSHAVAKHVVVGNVASASPSGASRTELVEPTRAQLEVARAAIDAAPFDGALCYARVDLAATDRGPLVVELELIEPYLFLLAAPAAADRLAAAIAHRAAR